MIVVNFQSMVKDAESGVAVTVLFDEGISDQRIEEIGELISERPEVSHYDFISADEAWESFKEVYFEGNEAAAASFAGDNPLANSASYAIYMNDISMQDSLVTYLKSVDGVREVKQSQQVANTLTDFNSLIGYISAGVILILLGVPSFDQQYDHGRYLRPQGRDCDHEADRSDGLFCPGTIYRRGCNDRTDRFRVTADLTLLRIQQCHYLCFGEVCIFKQYAEFPSGRTGIPCIGSGSVAVRCRHRISWKPRNNKETFERVNLHPIGVMLYWDVLII